MASFGATIRRALGPLERPVSDLYRGIFINLEDLAAKLRDWTDPKAVVEIGCGEGALAEKITRDFPEASYLGIDIIPHLGRMYDGRAEGVRFREVLAEDLARESPGAFDLVVINDVLHHVPDPLRQGILTAARDLLAPGGALMFKDWDRRPTPIHALCYFADAYIGGDKGVRYMPLAEQRALIAEVFGPDAIESEASIRPWRHNHAFLIRKA